MSWTRIILRVFLRSMVFCKWGASMTPRRAIRQECSATLSHLSQSASSIPGMPRNLRICFTPYISWAKLRRVVSSVFISVFISGTFRVIPKYCNNA